eukprot:scaffold140_cov247-Pinguiococcus_pyrenoidosus.AAC.17
MARIPDRGPGENGRLGQIPILRMDERRPAAPKPGDENGHGDEYVSASWGDELVPARRRPLAPRQRTREVRGLDSLATTSSPNQAPGRKEPTRPMCPLRADSPAVHMRSRRMLDLGQSLACKAS